MAAAVGRTDLTIAARGAIATVAAVVAAAAAGSFDVQADFGIARNARVPLCPPNPIEFEIAAVTGTVRA